MRPASPLGEPVLVTGGHGFIGRALVCRLQNSGHHTLAPTSGELDLREWEQVESFFRTHRPQTVFHLAASTKGRSGCDEFLESFYSNTVGGAHVIEACRRFGPARLVCLGTGDESGGSDAPDKMRDPGGPKRPKSVYAATKAASTLLCEAIGRCSELKPTVLRLFAVYGPGQSEDFLIPQLLRAVRDNKPLAMTGGRQRRDFLWLDDVVEVLYRIASCPASYGRTIDVCTGTIYSLRELVEILSELSGMQEPAIFSQIDYRPGEPFAIGGNPEPLLALLGPLDFTPLTQGLSRLLDSLAGEQKA